MEYKAGTKTHKSNDVYLSTVVTSYTTFSACFSMFSLRFFFLFTGLNNFRI